VDKKENIIEIPTSDEDLVISCLEEFNKDYKTKFEVIEVDVRDGVIFVLVDRAGASLSEVCLLGFSYGVKSQVLKSKGHTFY
jgi:hypothetical protein